MFGGSRDPNAYIKLTEKGEICIRWPNLSVRFDGKVKQNSWLKRIRSAKVNKMFLLNPMLQISTFCLFIKKEKRKNQKDFLAYLKTKVQGFSFSRPPPRKREIVFKHTQFSKHDGLYHC